MGSRHFWICRHGFFLFFLKWSPSELKDTCYPTALNIIYTARAVRVADKRGPCGEAEQPAGEGEESTAMELFNIVNKRCKKLVTVCCSGKGCQSRTLNFSFSVSSHVPIDNHKTDHQRGSQQSCHRQTFRCCF